MWWALVRSDAKQVPAMRELEKRCYFCKVEAS